MSAADRAVPVPDEQSAPYWAATARHELALAQCSACSAFSIPPDLVCAHCGVTDATFAFAPVSGHGVLKSWTIVRQAIVPGFDDEVPFVLADVELAEQAGLRMTGRLVDGVAALEDGRAHLDANVTVVFEDLPEASIPAFALAASADGGAR
jgi:uncharacterized OB-fold protein